MQVVEFGAYVAILVSLCVGICRIWTWQDRDMQPPKYKGKTLPLSRILVAMAIERER